MSTRQLPGRWRFSAESGFLLGKKDQSSEVRLKQDNDLKIPLALSFES